MALTERLLVSQSIYLVYASKSLYIQESGILFGNRAWAIPRGVTLMDGAGLLGWAVL